MDTAIETTAASATVTCSPGAKDRSPPAPSERFSATGAPGAIAMSTMPTSAARGNPAFATRRVR